MPMLELLLALGLGAVLAGGAALLVLARWELLLVVGLALIAIGFAVGVPAGVIYHMVLARRLAPRGQLAPRWWLRPVSFHGRLTPHERRHVMPWFVVGAIGFFVILAGCALAAVGAWRGRGI